MKQVRYTKKLDGLSYFDTETLSQSTGLRGSNMYQNVNRWIKSKNLIQLKKGLYLTQEYFLKENAKESYLEFIANKLRFPSYLSLEYVLSKYQVLTESVFVYTSISMKTTRKYSNQLGVFTYKNITQTLFTGFNIVDEDGYNIAIATKAKALFDYLYLKFYRKKDISKESIDDLRLNLDSFTKKEVQEFLKYCKLTKIKKYINVSKLLFTINDN